MSSDPGQGHPGAPVPPGQWPGHWQPPQVPYGQQQWPHQPQPPQSPWDQYRAQQQGGMPPPPPRKKRKLGLWLAIGLPVVLVAAGLTALLVTAPDRPTGTPVADAGNVKDLGSGSPTDPARFGSYWPAGPVKQYSTEVPAGDLTAADPRQLFFSMLKKQSTAAVTDYLHQTYQTPRDYQTQFQSGLTGRVAIDYRAKKFIEERIRIEADGKLGDDPFSRCVDGKSMTYFFSQSAWKPPTSSSGSDSCAQRLVPGKLVANAYTTDGITAAGLSPEDADKFVSYLDDLTGLFTVEKPQQIPGKDGKTYLQLDVTLHQLNPVKPGLEKEFKSPFSRLTGMGFLNAAFAQTGKQPYDYPYSIDLGDTEGRKMRYYLDPATLLPAYSVMMSMKPLNLDGTPAEDDRFANAYALFQYSYPKELDPQALRAEGVPTTTYRVWPFEQAVLKP